MADRNRALTTYRLFAVNDDDSILWDRCIDCFDDEEACATAAALSGMGVAVEVWDVARFVGSGAVVH